MADPGKVSPLGQRKKQSEEDDYEDDDYDEDEDYDGFE